MTSKRNPQSPAPGDLVLILGSGKRLADYFLSSRFFLSATASPHFLKTDRHPERSEGSSEVELSTKRNTYGFAWILLPQDAGSE